MKNLYVVDFGTGMVKIGITVNVEKRVAGIRTGAGIASQVKNLFVAHGDPKTIAKIEQSVLSLLAKFKTNGEWLEVDFDYVVNIVKGTQSAIMQDKSLSGDCFDLISSNFIGKTNVNLTEIAAAINKQRDEDGRPPYQLGAFLSSKSLADYIDAASKEWGVDQEEMLTRSGKASGSTVAHMSVGILLLESADMKSKVKIHKALIDGWNNEFFQRGGTEFFKLNAALSMSFGDDLNELANIAKLIRERILGEGAKTEDWNTASVPQTHLRYEWENKMCDMLRIGVIRDYEHAKEVIKKI